MSIEALFDHEVEVWESTETRGTLADRREVWAVKSTTGRKNASFQFTGMTLGTDGPTSPGQKPQGNLTAYLDKRLDVGADDVLKVTAGPDAPILYRCHHPQRPRGHHIEVPVEVWKGKLPEDES